MSLRHQVAVVTGGGRGIGRALALTFADAGASVAVFATTGSELAETVSLITRAGGEAGAWTLDVTDQDAVKRAIADVQARWGPIDLLVNNAAIPGPIGPLWESSPADWWRTQEVNVRGAILCSHAAIATMIARRRGRIINVVSGALPIAYFSAYMTSKSALIRFTECLAIETKPFGVSAFAMGPGTVRTAMSEHSLNSAEGQRWLPWFRRVFDQGLDVPIERPARLALRLASGEYDGLSGLTLTPLDDLESMRQALPMIDREKLYSLRIRTLPTSDAGALAAVRVQAEQPLDLSIRLTRTFSVGPDVVFDAWTDSATIAKWFLPPEEARWVEPPVADPRPDGELSLRAIVRGEPYHLFGRYRRVERPVMLSLQWSWRDLPIIDTHGDTELTLRLAATPEGCAIELVHVGFLTAQARDAHERGWMRCLDSLGQVLNSSRAGRQG
jgi:NAD(P)-dependent dehydrogenase (short-subunit alcohol dehydrogenase family)/uncharacterized protein YndB with AHSA1/START domain